MKRAWFVITIIIFLLYLCLSCKRVTDMQVITLSGLELIQDMATPVPLATPPALPSSETNKQSDRSSIPVTPSPMPTSTPTPNPTPSINPYGLLPEGNLVSMDYFNSAVFIGDSITYTFKKYVEKQRTEDRLFMGTATFLAVMDFGLHHALTTIDAEDAVHPTYLGKKWLIEDFIAYYNYNHIYIMLGINDIGRYGIDSSIDNYAELIRRIRTQSPSAIIHILSVTPMTKNGQKSKLNSPNINTFNESMQAWAKDNQCYFLDIASVLKDSEGYLHQELSKDDYVHLTPEAFPLWIDYLRTRTVYDLHPPQRLHPPLSASMTSGSWSSFKQ